MWSTGSKERVGQQASWGPGVPTPGCLGQWGRKATTRAGRPSEWQNPGTWVPDPGCLAQRAHRAEPMLKSSQFLGSPPWLFVHLVLRLRTVYMYLPQLIASCLRSPPEDRNLPTLSSAAFPAAAPCPLHYIHARWKFEYPLTLSSSFVEWYMARLRFGPRLMAVCAHLRISSQLLEHAQVLSCVCVPLAGAPEGTVLSKQPADSLLRAAPPC